MSSGRGRSTSNGSYLSPNSHFPLASWVRSQLMCPSRVLFRNLVARSSRTHVLLYHLSFLPTQRSDTGSSTLTKVRTRTSNFRPGSDFDADSDLDLGLEIVDWGKGVSSTPMRVAKNFTTAHIIRLAVWITRIAACRWSYTPIAESRCGPSFSSMVYTNQSTCIGPLALRRLAFSPWLPVISSKCALPRV